MKYAGDKFDRAVLEFKREYLKRELAKCPPKQQALFAKMYVSVDKMKEKQMTWASSQIEQGLIAHEKEDKMKPVHTVAPATATEIRKVLKISKKDIEIARKALTKVTGEKK